MPPPPPALPRPTRPGPASYWMVSRAPRYSLLFALPLLILYELLAALLAGPRGAGVRNAADVLVKTPRDMVRASVAPGA